MKIQVQSITPVLLILLITVLACGRHHFEYAGPPPPQKTVVLPEEKGKRGLTPYIINGERYYPIPDSDGFVQEGVASWYGEEFHGRPTANGEVFDMYKRSAAHTTLPLGTYVKVTNLSTNKHIIVRINDRGPFVKGRIIDLSYAAAREIDLVGPGTALVKVVALGKEVRKIDSPTGKKPVIEFKDLSTGDYTIQIGAFREREKALRLVDKLKPIYKYTDIEMCNNNSAAVFYRVRVSRSRSLAAAEQVKQELESMGFEQAFIVGL